MKDIFNELFEKFKLEEEEDYASVPDPFDNGEHATPEENPEEPISFSIGATVAIRSGLYQKVEKNEQGQWVYADEQYEVVPELATVIADGPLGTVNVQTVDGDYIEVPEEKLSAVNLGESFTKECFRNTVKKSAMIKESSSKLYEKIKSLIESKNKVNEYMDPDVLNFKKALEELGLMEYWMGTNVPPIFEMELDGDKLLHFGFATGPLGYSVSKTNGESLEISDEMEKENASSEEMKEFISNAIDIVKAELGISESIVNENSLHTNLMNVQLEIEVQDIGEGRYEIKYDEEKLKRSIEASILDDVNELLNTKHYFKIGQWTSIGFPKVVTTQK